MTRGQFPKWALIAVACLMGTPAIARAQSVITGVVRDSSGGVLPGVTVEASSPVLIEKVRTAVTDSQGQYRIVDLRSGTYVVTFSLAGFANVRQEGLQLPALFTATVNAELSVADVAETVTVSGGAPLVDVQTVVKQTVLTEKILDEIPTGRSIWANSQLVPGVTTRRGTNGARDVGGTQAGNQSNVTAHGSTNQDGTQMMNGMRINGITADGGDKTYINQGAIAEFSYATSAIGADVSGGGVRLNMILKDGGNRFSGTLFTSYTNDSLQAAPMTAKLAASGLKVADNMQRVSDVNLSVGGPILKDDLWFFTSYRRFEADLPQANAFYTDTSVPNVNTWTPDLSKQVVEDNRIQSGSIKLLYQIDRKNRLSAYYEKPSKFRGHEAVGSGTFRARESFFHRGGFSRDETGGIYQTPGEYWIAQVKWTGAWTNKLLLEAGFQRNNQSPPVGAVLPDLAVGISKGVIPTPKFDIATQTRWGAPSTDVFLQSTHRDGIMAAVSYILGSNALKFGIDAGSGKKRLQRYFEAPGVNFIQQYSNGVPTSVVIYNDPNDQRSELKHDIGIYVQDSWTIHRLTVSPGIRFEYLRSGYPEQGIPIEDQQLTLLEGYAVRQVFPAVDNLPNWKNWSPRLGVAYDLFGDAKTVVKASVSRYQAAQSVGLTERYNPMRSQTETRTWTDTNHNFLYDPGIDALGPTSNVNFGNISSAPSPDLKRGHNTEFTVELQRQLTTRMAAGVGYFRRVYGNLDYSDNPVLDVPGAFTPITVVNPCLTNPQWNCPGKPVPSITIYSINPALQGQGKVVDATSTTNTRVYNGVEASFSLRMSRATAFAGVTVDRSMANNCQPYSSAFANASNPNAAQQCDDSVFDIPFQAQTKIGGSYELPFKFRLSGTFQSNPSDRANSIVTYTFTRQATPGLTQASVTAPLLVPGSYYLPRHNQVDFRLARSFGIGASRLELQMDVFNALNSRNVDAITLAAGPTLGTPTLVLQPRFVAFGAQFHF